MNDLIEKLRAQAEEFRIYAKAECLPSRAQQWQQWAENCEQAAKELEWAADPQTATQEFLDSLPILCRPEK